jgi:hypothetical protein
VVVLDNLKNGSEDNLAESPPSAPDRTGHRRPSTTAPWSNAFSNATISTGAAPGGKNQRSGVDRPPAGVFEGMW